MSVFTLQRVKQYPSCEAQVVSEKLSMNFEVVIVNIEGRRHAARLGSRRRQKSAPQLTRARPGPAALASAPGEQG